MNEHSDREILERYRQLGSVLAESNPTHFTELQARFREATPRRDCAFLQFLGTGQGAHNSAAKGYLSGLGRTVSGPVLNSGSAMVWLDPGPDSLLWIDRLPFDARHVDGIVISHAHPDHYGNLVCTIEAVTGGTEIRGAKTVLGNRTALEGAKGSPPLIPDYHRDCVLREARAVDVGCVCDVGDISIRALKASHRETAFADATLNWAMTMDVHGRPMTVVFYDGNVYESEKSDSVIEDCTGDLWCDILVVNVGNHVKCPIAEQNYPSTRGLLWLAKNTTASLVVTTHFGIEMLCLTPEEESLLASHGFSNEPEFQAALIQKELEQLGIQNRKVVAAQDGTCVCINRDRFVLQRGADDLAIPWLLGEE